MTQNNPKYTKYNTRLHTIPNTSTLKPQKKIKKIKKIGRPRNIQSAGDGGCFAFCNLLEANIFCERIVCYARKIKH